MARGSRQKCVQQKLSRLRDGAAPRILDLFSGCGGLTLGFQLAGGRSLGGVEIDPLASRSYALNFHRDEHGQPLEAHAAPKDILKLEPQKLLHDFGYDKPKAEIDLIVGGPPCPAYTRVGRAKLREVQNHPQAYKLDPRAKLYVPYLKFVEQLQPIALVMENVPEILNWGGHNLGEEICETLEDMGYICIYTLLNAASYGVPQTRERFFLLAVHEEVGSAPRLPPPTRRVDLPSGYTGTRNFALKQLQTARERAAKPTRYQEAPLPPGNAAPPVTVREALSDLPPINAHLHGKDQRGTRRLNNKVPYGEGTPSAYAKQMRGWPGFESTGFLVDHVTRCLSWRDYRLFEKMEHGDDYPKAVKLAEKLFAQRIKELTHTGDAPRPGSHKYKELHANYVPPYDPKKFPNKWRKMPPDEPARTLMAHLGKDTYSHIHYDSEQARVISVREAARLQSFPDGFRFAGTMNPAFRQIGNSVPPLLAYEIAKALIATMRMQTSFDLQNIQPAAAQVA